jgi:DNA topoisomerase IA
MVRKKYLILVEKPSIAKMVREAYEHMGNNVKFDADIVPVTSHVENIETSCLNKQSISEFSSFTLKGMDVSDKFVVYDYGNSQIQFAEDIKELVRRNHYDAIVNACDTDEEGDLEFQYTIEHLSLTEFETRRLYFWGYCLNNLEDELMTLNEN